MWAKFKLWFVGLLAIFNVIEGGSHLVMGSLSLYGIIISEKISWLVWFAPVESLIFGIFSVLTGLILGKWTHHHH